VSRAIAVALAGVLAGCGSSGQRAASPFGEAWPDRARSYEQAVEDWTRTGSFVRDFDRVLEVSATFLAPDWRAAYIEHRAEREMLGRDRRAELVAEQRTAAESYYEVELFVTTYRYEENDLQKGEKSTWRVTLLDDDGNELRPVEIQRDRRPPEIIRSYFPHARDGATAYVARFPRTQLVMGDGARKFSLTVASARGGVELVWTAR
jgi:hypothetical protein